MPSENTTIRFSTTSDNAGLDDEVGFEDVLSTVCRIIDANSGQPFVIGVNSSWGTGKTFFLEMLSEKLEGEGASVAFFNSWENDFLDNALTCLIGELKVSLEAISSSGGEETPLLSLGEIGL